MADASHPELDRQIAAVDGILADMELNEVPRVLILNKWDRLEDEMRDILRDRWPDALPISAETRDASTRFPVASKTRSTGKRRPTSK